MCPEWRLLAWGKLEVGLPAVGWLSLAGPKLEAGTKFKEIARY